MEKRRSFFPKEFSDGRKAEFTQTHGKQLHRGDVYGLLPSLLHCLCLLPFPLSLSLWMICCLRIALQGLCVCVCVCVACTVGCLKDEY